MFPLSLSLFYLYSYLSSLSTHYNRPTLSLSSLPLLSSSSSHFLSIKIVIHWDEVYYVPSKMINCHISAMASPTSSAFLPRKLPRPLFHTFPYLSPFSPFFFDSSLSSHILPFCYFSLFLPLSLFHYFLK